MRKIVLMVAVLAIATPSGMFAGHIEHHGCYPCHTPHHVIAEDTMGVPLWSGFATTKTFTLYSSDTMVGTPGQPDGSTKMCLSCHDGTNPYIARLVEGHTVPSNFEDDLSDSHPVSIEYAPVYTARPTEYNDPATIPVGYLEKGKVQCSSCHDVHDGEGEGHAELRGFEYVDDAGGGALCQVCHAKG
jgi:hypothetical protein